MKALAVVLCGIVLSVAVLTRGRDADPGAVQGPAVTVAKGNGNPHSTPTRVAAAREPVLSAPRPDTPRLEADATDTHEWTPSPGSPLTLPGSARGFVPSLKRLRREVAEMDVCNPLNPEAIIWTEDVEHLWTICNEDSALAVFIMEHAAREEQRWLKREQSVPLEVELLPVQAYIDRRFGFDEEVWELVNQYSQDTQALLRSDGRHAGDEDIESAWQLLDELSGAGEPAWDALLETLFQQQNLTYEKDK